MAYRRSMEVVARLAIVALGVACSASLCAAATISGAVRGPNGSPFRGAFVQARNSTTKITTMVLSNDQGKYAMSGIAPGEYQLQIKAVGFEGPAPADVKLSGGNPAQMNFSLRQGMVRWSDISIEQADKLWAPSSSKKKLFSNCFVCHGFQTRMAAVRRDADGWRDRVRYMREAMHFSLAERVNEADAVDIASYLTSLFGPDSVLPKSPAEMPEYSQTLRHFTSDSMKIVYVEYELPKPNQFPFSAAPDKSGNVWIPDFGVANAISRLNPLTGEFETFPVPNAGTAAVHSAVAAPDGSVWLTEQGPDKLGRWNPETHKITEYQAPHVDSKPGMPPGNRHTLRFDRAGNVWSGSYPMTKFDPETGKFTVIEGVPISYSLIFDKNGDPWFTAPFASQIGKVNWPTLKVSTWNAPTPNCYPRRLDIDADGNIWFGEYGANKIGRFDPKTQSFKEYEIPGPEATPYALGVGPDQTIWYSSYNQDVIGRVDPATGKVTEYPFPHSENTMREFFRDAQGRMWYGSPSNNRVGYFYLAKNSGD